MNYALDHEEIREGLRRLCKDFEARMILQLKQQACHPNRN